MGSKSTAGDVVRPKSGILPAGTISVPFHSFCASVLRFCM